MSRLSASPDLAEPPAPADLPSSAPPGLSVRFAADDADVVISLDGEVDIATVGRLDSAIRRALATSAPEIVIDLTACHFIDSAGIGTLLRLDRRLAADGERTLLILPGPENVQRTFRVCGLLDVLPFAEG